MRRIKISFLLIFGIIVVIVGIGIVIPEIYFAESYSGVTVDQEWNPVSTNTPTESVTPSSTPTIQIREVSAVSPTPTIKVNCVYPFEYWEDHPELWLDLLVGDKVYTKQEIQLTFDHPTPNIYQTLLKQIYLSNLNIYSGADPKTIQDVLGNANRWMQENPPDKQMSQEVLSVGGQIAQTLSAFNAGLIGPGYCSPYETLTVTPLVILSPTSISSPTATATATATRVIVTARPTSTATKEKDSDNKPEPTNPPKPTKQPDTPVPPPTDPPPPPKPTELPTDAPPDP